MPSPGSHVTFLPGSCGPAPHAGVVTLRFEPDASRGARGARPRVARVAPVRSRETRVAAGRVGSSRGGQVPRRPSYKNTCFNGKTPRVRKSQTANRVHGARTAAQLRIRNSTERAQREIRKVKTQKESRVTSRKTNVFNVENSVSHSQTLRRQLSGKWQWPVPQPCAVCGIWNLRHGEAEGSTLDRRTGP